MNCRICNTELIKSDLEDFYYCPHCNKKFKISSIKKCKSCSTPLKKCEDDTWFCPSCGKKYRFSSIRKEDTRSGKVEEKKEADALDGSLALSDNENIDHTVNVTEERHASEPEKLVSIAKDDIPKINSSLEETASTTPNTDETKCDKRDTPEEETRDIPHKKSEDNIPNIDDVLDTEIVAHKEESPIDIDDLLEDEDSQKNNEEAFSIGDVIEDDSKEKKTEETNPSSVESPSKDSYEHLGDGKKKKFESPSPSVVIKLADDDTKSNDEPREIEPKKDGIKVTTLEELSAEKKKKKDKGNSRKGKIARLIGIIAGVIALLFGIFRWTYIRLPSMPINVDLIVFDIYYSTSIVVWGLGIIISIALLINLQGGQKVAGIGYLLASLFGVAYAAYVYYGNSLQYEQKVAFFNELYKYANLLVFIPIGLVFLAGTFTLILMNKSDRNSKKAAVIGIIVAILAALAEASEILEKITPPVILKVTYDLKYALLGMAFLLLPIFTPIKE